jgi:hypothetical protein
MPLAPFWKICNFSSKAPGGMKKWFYPIFGLVKNFAVFDPKKVHEDP